METLSVIRNGNSTAVILTKKIRQHLNVVPGDKVQVITSPDGSITISKVVGDPIANTDYSTWDDQFKKAKKTSNRKKQTA
jgi:antitoxin component of MazEF toxin-antitoxin module